MASQDRKDKRPHVAKTGKLEEKQSAHPKSIVEPLKVSEISTSDLKQHYEDMLLIRRFEEKAAQLYGMGQIAGFCHLYIGQEAVVVGMQAEITSQDAVITTYRDHGHMLAIGMDPKGVMAELLGRETGYSKGKGGSMHMFSKEKNFFGGHGIVGANVPLGAGIAFAFKYRGENHLCLTYYGDGAANQGQVYETYNMAALWKLPVVFIIENNQYGMGTSVGRHCANPEEMYNRGRPFGIPGYIADGQDILAVRAAGRLAVEHVRSGKGPILLEMKTYRYRGHSMSDPAKYRTKEEVDHVKENADPLELAKSYLKEKGVLEEELKDISKKVKDIVNEATLFAQHSKEPDPAELYTDITIED